MRRLQLRWGWLRLRWSGRSAGCWLSSFRCVWKCTSVEMRMQQFSRSRMHGRRGNSGCCGLAPKASSSFGRGDENTRRWMVLRECLVGESIHHVISHCLFWRQLHASATTKRGIERCRLRRSTIGQWLQKICSGQLYTVVDIATNGVIVRGVHRRCNIVCRLSDGCV